MKVEIIRKFFTIAYLLIVLPLPYFDWLDASTHIYLPIVDILGISLLLLEFRKKTRLNRLIFLFLVFSLVMYLINSFLFNSYNYVIIVGIFAQVGFGMAVIKSDFRIIFKVNLLVLLLLAFYSLYKGFDPGQFMAHSRSVVSVYAIAAFVLYYIGIEITGSYSIKKNEVLILSLMLVLICMIALGRSGIINSVILFSGVIYKYSIKQIKELRIGAFIVASMFVFLLIYFVFGLTFENTKFAKLENKLESERNRYNQIYFNQLDTETLIFGKSSAYASFLNWENNPHNSYIRLHMKIGAGLFIVIIMIIYSLLIFVKNKKYILFSSLLALSIRAFTDTHLIIGNYTNFSAIVALFCIAYYIKNKVKHKVSSLI